MNLMQLSWRQPAPPIALICRGPDQSVTDALIAGRTGHLAVVIGPPGPGGPPGPPNDNDPGDLTLVFDNKLI